MKKFVIALDLDATLLNSQGKISSNTLEKLKSLKQQDFVIVISTTRGYAHCVEIEKQIVADYVCCQSGNMIFKNGNVIYKNPFSKKQIDDFVDKFSTFTDEIYVDTADKGLLGKVTDYANEWGVTNCKLSDLSKYDAYKVCVHYNKDTQKLIEDYCAQNNFVCRPMPNQDYMLITQAQSDKYFALKKVLRMEKTDLEHLIVFGDDTSDLLSIQKAKFGVAMNNAKENVKSGASFITKSNDEDGIAYFFDNLFVK